MKVSELPIPREVSEALNHMGIVELFPPQEEAVSSGLLDGESQLIATATASGKTLLAALAAIKAREEGLKTIYLTPLRALTTEKAEFFKRVMEPVGGRVAAVSRDYDSPEEWLKSVDVVVATYEKADSLVRHKASWLRDLGLIVIDELHLLADPERGPRLEAAATALMKMAPKAQRLGLSATVTNADEVARWMGAKVISSNWRPVPLRQGVYHNGRIYYADGQEVEVPGGARSFDALILNCILDGGQVMIYASSRKRSEEYAVRMAEKVGNLACLDRRALAKDAEAIRAEGRGFDIAEKLASCVSRGVAFHHAGLAYPHRYIVEMGFRERRIKVICATPTLAAGVNIPARMVVIPEVKKGAYEMKVMEYKQLAGRAGRPGLDPYGEVITVATSRRALRRIFARYINAEPEPVVSQLADRAEWAVLAALASGICEDAGELREFMESTLAASQGKIGYDRIMSSVDYLARLGLVEVRGEDLRLTRLGRRVAELCVHPINSVIARRLASVEPYEDVLLAAIAASPDVPAPPVEMTLTAAEAAGRAFEMLGWGLEGDEGAYCYGKFLVLKLWVNEASEQVLANTYDVAPGDLLVLKEAAEWVAFSLSELLMVLGRAKHSAAALQMTERIRHGVRPELIPLCALEGVGRVRARALYSAGFKTIEDVASASIEDLSSIHGIGHDLAVRIREHARRLIGGDAAWGR